MNTRRYHGLLVAATRPPVGRMVLLSKLEETLVVHGRRTELSCNRYPGVIHPQGHLYLKRFRQDPFPVFVYEAEGVEIEKSVFMVYGENTTVVQYAASAPCVLELRPLVAFRDYHATTHENGALRSSFETGPGEVVLALYPGLPELRLSHTEGWIQTAGYWYRNLEYEAEQQRGLDYREDLFNPLVLGLDITRSRPAAIVASVEGHRADEADALRTAEIRRRNAIRNTAPVGHPLVRTLVQAADQFLVKRKDRTTVIAGYHWFSDWGRDTMIALPGLTLATRRYEDARSILLSFAEHVDQGMLPNRFPDAGEAPEYNTVDATLWFFEAIRALAAHTGDYEFVRARLYGLLAEIVSWHERGTRYGIRVDGDGLLQAGAPGVQLTWMDAKVGDWVVTPRHDKPVEIEALWYNALRIMENLARRFGDHFACAHYAGLADSARERFNRLFWNEGADCLYDVVNGDLRDGSIRPNQVFAVSLFHSMLPVERAKNVLAVVERHLLTPYGLRTLAPSDPQYRARYEGDRLSRDAAYHQGTVWPWLIGPFVTAYLRVNGRSAAARDQAAAWLNEFRRFVEDEGLGQIPEVFDGEAPHRPGGCIAQAWSVAEVLRCVSEEIDADRPIPFA